MFLSPFHLQQQQQQQKTPLKIVKQKVRKNVFYSSFLLTIFRLFFLPPSPLRQKNRFDANSPFLNTLSIATNIYYYIHIYFAAFRKGKSRFTGRTVSRDCEIYSRY